MKYYLYLFFITADSVQQQIMYWIWQQSMSGSQKQKRSSKTFVVGNYKTNTTAPRIPNIVTTKVFPDDSPWLFAGPEVDWEVGPGVEVALVEDGVVVVDAGVVVVVDEGDGVDADEVAVVVEEDAAEDVLDVVTDEADVAEEELDVAEVDFDDVDAELVELLEEVAPAEDV